MFEGVGRQSPAQPRQWVALIVLLPGARMRHHGYLYRQRSCASPQEDFEASASLMQLSRFG
jgi:hypothetical protein